MKNRAPLVTVIMPTFNRAHLIAESLDCVYKQTYENWECIVVDDGSTDTTAEIVQKYLDEDKRFHYYKKDNGGAGNARNYGIEKSQGEYILPLDSDDLIGVTYLEKGVAKFQQNDQLKIVYSEAIKIGEEEGKWNLPSYSYPLFLVYNMIFNSSMYKRIDFNNVGGYDENNMHEDWDLWIKLLKNGGEVYQIPETLYFYRTHNKDSVTANLAADNFLYKKSMDQLFKNHIDEYLTHIGNPIELERERRELYSKVNSAKYELGMKIVNHKLFKFIRSIYSLVKGNKGSN